MGREWQGRCFSPTNVLNTFTTCLNVLVQCTGHPRGLPEPAGAEQVRAGAEEAPAPFGVLQSQLWGVGAVESCRFCT